jgi:endonuclease/exonuclease/phosphatase family metal-dependent hydrolase
MNAVLNKQKYSDADKKKIIDLMKALGIAKKDDGGDYVILRQNRGKLLTRKKNGTIEITASGRGDWIGWLDLKYEPVNEIGTRNTAQVVVDLDADVIGLVEAESRPALLRFRDTLLGPKKSAYPHVMLIDGNDTRGIDVAIMTKKGYDIASICSHVDDTDATGQIYSRDCAQYEIRTPKNNTLMVLVNHFKSKGYNTTESADAKRTRQAKRTKQIYEAVVKQHDFVAVIGDLNDTPDSKPLQALIKTTSLKDISQHPSFADGGFPGTFGPCGPKQKIDYILLSPKLMARVSAGGMFRKGAWPGVKPKKWVVYDTIKEPIHVASDHSAIWAEFNL